jgi:hypothetical protein
MGKLDRRKSLKMRRRKGQAKKKAHLARLKEQNKVTPTEKKTSKK